MTFTRNDVKLLVELSRLYADAELRKDAKAQQKLLASARSAGDDIARSILSDETVMRPLVDFIKSELKKRELLESEIARLEDRILSERDGDAIAKSYNVEPIQTYKTVVFDKICDTSVFFLTLPSRSLPLSARKIIQPSNTDSHVSQHGEWQQLVRQLIEQLGLHELVGWTHSELRHMEESFEGEALARTIGLFFKERKADPADLLKITGELVASALNPSDLTDEQLRFATYLTDAPIIPFEHSPLTGVSLKEITKASGAAIGAYMGFVVGGSTPLLFITVPTGMLICGFAGGMAHGIEGGLARGLAKRIEAFLKVKTIPSRKRAPKKIKSSSPKP
ncbi:hypothetical protein PQQ75_15925 [Paraburkholderia aspalathi]|uniref:hypothetical protein n=1 Tax=Paraburkholderia aspalathi TaxID=1324617 RepID=UPI0038BDCA97